MAGRISFIRDENIPAKHAFLSITAIESNENACFSGSNSLVFSGLSQTLLQEPVLYLSMELSVQEQQYLVREIARETGAKRDGGGKNLIVPRCPFLSLIHISEPTRRS